MLVVFKVPSRLPTFPKIESGDLKNKKERSRVIGPLVAAQVIFIENMVFLQAEMPHFEKSG
jgi:hypothetical protein